jgi:hypothetical protein
MQIDDCNENSELKGPNYIGLFQVKLTGVRTAGDSLLTFAPFEVFESLQMLNWVNSLA